MIAILAIGLAIIMGLAYLLINPLQNGGVSQGGG